MVCVKVCVNNIGMFKKEIKVFTKSINGEFEKEVFNDTIDYKNWNYEQMKEYIDKINSNNLNVKFNEIF